MFKKILASLLIFIAAIVFGGLSGLTFYIWPTFIHDDKLAVTPEVLQRLASLQLEKKFGPDPSNFYPGAVSEEQRAAAQAAVDSTIKTLISELPVRPQRSTVLRAMKVTLADFDTSESEERDQLLAYLTKVIEICGVSSSSELFNVWRYGFPYGWIL